MQQDLLLVEGVVKATLWPFDIGMLSMQVIEKLNAETVIIIRSSTFVDDEVVINGRALYALPDTTAMALYVGTEVANHFKSLMNIDPEPNIILGEN